MNAPAQINPKPYTNWTDRLPKPKPKTPPRPPKKQNASTQVSNEVYTWLQSIAKEREISMSKVIEAALTHAYMEAQTNSV